jgi:hypothetical protein
MAQFTIYRSSDSGATAMSGTVGSLINVLTACLVDGYTASVTSITRSGSTATVTCANAHGFNTGNSTTIAGANESDYNGTFTVTVTGTTTFTYTVPGTPTTPATGTITWKKLGAGWTKPYTGVNLAAFKNGGGCQMYLRVNDAGPGAGGAKEARALGYETMSDVNTGTGLFPTAAQFANGMFIRKSTTADATSRSYIVVADSRTFYLFVLTGDTAGCYYCAGFGEFYSLVTSDSYRNWFTARNAENNTGATVECMGLLSVLTAVTNNYVPRGYTGLGTAVDVGKHGDGVKGSTGGFLGTVANPNPEDGKLFISPVWIQDNATAPTPNIRGRMRGLWQWCHSLASATDQDTFSGTGLLAGKTFLVIKTFPAFTAGAVGVAIIETSDTLETN